MLSTRLWKIHEYDEWVQKGCPYLVHVFGIYIGDTRLPALSPFIGGLSSILTDLFLGRNQLVSLPDSIGNLRHLRILRIEHNQLTSLSDSICNLVSLKYLDVSNNKLVSLPDSIGNLHRLEFLVASHNLLESLPESFGNLTDLTSLNLCNNQLKSLPDSIINLSRLNYVLLDGYFSYIPTNFPVSRYLTVDYKEEEVDTKPARVID